MAVLQVQEEERFADDSDIQASRSGGFQDPSQISGCAGREPEEVRWRSCVTCAERFLRLDLGISAKGHLHSLTCVECQMADAGISARNKQAIERGLRPAFILTIENDDHSRD